MDRGIFASWDRGREWINVRNNLPPVSVRDIKIHPRENDLIIGTHGRGAWILDDITPLQNLSEAMKADAHLFNARHATRWQAWRSNASLGQRTFAAPNPPDGAFINYYLKDKPEGPVKITVTDADGAKVTEWTEKQAKPGVNRAVWNLRYEGPAPLASQPAPTGFFARFARMGPPAMPGEYTIKLRAGESEHTTKVTLESDPRIEMSQADYQAQFDASMKLRNLVTQVHGAIDTTATLRKQLEGLEEALEASGKEDTELVTEAIGSALEEIKELDNRLQRPVSGLGYRQYPRMRDELRSLSFSIMGSTSPPTEPQMTVLKELEQDTAQLLSDVDEMIGTTIRDLNELLGSYPKIMVKVSGTE
jgi:hypothetical protein